MANIRIRKGDTVRVVRGNNRGQEGTVIRVDQAKDRVVVEGVNMRKRHRRPTQQEPEGGITSFEAPVHVSNVMLLDPEDRTPTRVRIRRNEDGSKERVAPRSERVIPNE